MATPDLGFTSPELESNKLLEQRRDAYLVWAKVANSLPLSDDEDSGLSYSNLLEISAAPEWAWGALATADIGVLREAIAAYDDATKGRDR